MGITYDGVNNIITVDDYSESSPCTFQDIYDADVAGGWNVVTKQGGNQFYFQCRLVIGAGTNVTWLIDTSTMIEFYTQTGYGFNDIELGNNGNIRLGTLVDDDDKTTKDGCCIKTHVDITSRYGHMLKCNSGAKAYLYGCFFQDDGTYKKSEIGKAVRAEAGSKVYNCIFDNLKYYCVTTTNYNNLSTNVYQAYINCTGSFNIVKIFGCETAFYAWTGYDFSVYDAVVRDATTIGHMLAITTDKLLINCDSDVWDIGWYSSASTAKLCRQYELDLRVTDESGDPIVGASVVLKDKNDTQVFSVTTDSNGDIVTQTVTYADYADAGGTYPHTNTTTTTYSPFTMTISKAGTTYLTQVHKLDLDSKTKEQISMTDVADIVDGIDDLETKLDTNLDDSISNVRADLTELKVRVDDLETENP